MLRKVRARVLVWVGFGLFAAVGGQGLLAGQPQAQQEAPPAPPPINESDDPILKRFVWRSIGPAVMGGRVDDIAVEEGNPSVIYVGYATGGIWKTTNNGTTWTPIFDQYPVSSIGDIEIAPSNPNIIYVGTGEANNRQSSSFGAGVYKSTDGGKKFEYVGLKETQSIAKIVVHPKDANIVYVAAIGHLFGPNAERGLFKSTDGGKTWTNAKFIDNDTGFIDLVMHPTDPNTLMAASYQRRRQPWGFNGGGANSGIWKTTDAGKTWTKLTGNGLPPIAIIGRIGLNYSRSKPNVVYAQIEVGASGGTGAGVNDDGSLAPPGQGRAGGGGGGGRGGQPQTPDPKKSGVWRSDDGGKTWAFRSNNNNRPMYYSNIRVDPNNPDTVYTTGASAYKSLDGGKTFTAFDNFPRNGPSHSDHHALWINPRNSQHIVIGNDGGLDVSYDQGETWEELSLSALGQFYAISVDMRKPYYVCGGLQDNGSWCGPSAVRNSSGITNTDWYRIGGGDGFYTANDPRDWTIGYSESQDGATNRYDLRAGTTRPIRPSPPLLPINTGQQGQRGQAGSGQAAAPATAGRGQGAGGQAAGTGQAAGAGQAAGGGQPAGGQPAGGQPQAGGTPDPEAPQSQQGGGRGGGRFGGPGNVVPPPPPGTTYRFYWSTPFVLSKHNPDVVYLGADRLFKSTTRGDSWTASPDLTRNIGRNDRPIMGVDGNAAMASKHDGAASYSNIVTIGESPLVPGIVWVGTNDGNVQVTRDDGATWKNVVENVKGVPPETHVSRVEPSHFDAGTAYVTFDGHRTDDHKPYVFVTRDFGQTWTSIAANLPEGNVNVIREDPRNRNLLYLGTEYAFYISLNGGKEWKRFMTGLPTVRIDDILVHPRDNDLIVGTHGRSIWIIDDITPLQEMTEAVTTSEAHLFSVRPAIAWANDIMKAHGLGGDKHFIGQNPEGGTVISYYLRAAPADDVKITISNASGQVVRELNGKKDAGLNRVLWNLAPNTPAGAAGRGGFGGRGGRGGRASFVTPNAVPAGTYVVKLTIGGKELMTTVRVEEDNLR
ncbi:MAG TPA: hypothetical protein VFJ02_12885 [Vicinamibacterales bacterium]|nr:hypothetical protein [Vicinamibacterales bacterium]